MLDPIPSLPRSNQALEWNQLFESRDQHYGWWPALARSDRPKGRFGLDRPKLEREREGRLGGAHGGGGGLGWRWLWWSAAPLGSVRPKRGERRGEQEREREMCWND